MEKEYTCWMYLIFLSASYVQGKHCTRYCDEFCRFSFLLEGNVPVSFIDSVSCLSPNIWSQPPFPLHIHWVTPFISLALIADNSQICSPSEELFRKLQMLPGISNSAHMKLNYFTFLLSFWHKRIPVRKFLRQFKNKKAIRNCVRAITLHFPWHP